MTSETIEGLKSSHAKELESLRADFKNRMRQLESQQNAEEARLRAHHQSILRAAMNAQERSPTR